MGKGQQGFTLTELMVVLGIGTILAMLAVPRLMGLQRRLGLGAEARSFYSAFIEAQGLAASTGRPSRLIVDRAGRRWTIRADRNDDGELESVTSHELFRDYIEFGPSGGLSSAFPAPYDDVPNDSWCSFCDDSSGSIDFDIDGTVTTGESGSVLLRSNQDVGGRAFALVFIGATGSVRLFEVSD